MSAGEYKRYSNGSGAFNSSAYDAAEAPDGQSRGGPSGYVGRYTDEEAQMVDQAKQRHRRTTDSSANALQTALKTRELGANTVEELHRQGQRLEIVEGDLNEIDTDIKEAKGILAYMRRCCLCFLCACCCDCDPSKQADETRKQRVAMRKEFRTQEQQMQAQAGLPQRAYNNKPNGVPPPGGEEKQRSELMGNIQMTSQNGHQRDNSAYRIGEDLEDEDRQQIQSETAKQEKHLDQIGDVLNDIKGLANDMNTELGIQDERLGRLNDRTDTTLGNIKEVQKGITQDFNIREKKGSSSGFKPSKLTGAMYAAKSALK